MRNTFVRELIDIAKKDRDLIVLSGDLGFSVFESYIDQMPDQFINAGIAEQSMTGIAAGLAMEGKKPVIYSIIPFVTMRNFEQIRNDICYQNVNVKIVGVGAGFSYGPYGHTHHSLEDIGILRTLPNMTIFAPGDPLEVSLVTREAFASVGPAYIRLGKSGESVIHKNPPEFATGKGIVISKGKDLALFVCSTMLETASIVREKLEQEGISVSFISMPSIKPLDVQLIMDMSKECNAIVSIEEHSVIGGLGSAIAEVLAEHGGGIPFKRIAVPDRFTKTIGSQEFMRNENGLSIPQILQTIKSVLNRNE